MKLNIYSCAYFLSVLSSLVKYLLMSFVHFLIRLFAYLLLSFESSLYIIDINPLLAMGLDLILMQSSRKAEYPLK